ncbi:unnamed protein product [Sphagnum tenellum]
MGGGREGDLGVAGVAYRSRREGRGRVENVTNVELTESENHVDFHQRSEGFAGFGVLACSCSAALFQAVGWLVQHSAAGSVQSPLCSSLMTPTHRTVRCLAERGKMWREI